MATGIDYRRSDQRTSVLETPYWITSGEVVGLDAEDLAAMLFSFPVASRMTLVHEILVQVTTVFTVSAGALVLTLGTGTLATDAITTAGTVTDRDVNCYMESVSDVTSGTLGYYAPGTGDFKTAKAAGSLVDADVMIVGAASTVPCVCIYLSNAGGSITAGKLRVHMLVSNLPGF